ncbi:protein kinase [Actinoplanes sp. NPDC051861]|uniref:serine/threonine-protein kinase n=1 Tax=Actinoplanes sp. NPDC051861 TaxID=3155170 RepID=UPI00342E883B
MEVDRKLGGRYRLGDELGRGGMAVVFRALDEVLNRPVAVKVLAGRYAGEPRFRERILHEARAAATLSHPNIAQIYDFGESEEDGRPVPYVVMELINGPTLQQRVARGRIPPRRVFRICGEIASALAVAHEDGLVHRDIKLANVMVTPTGAKVVDFGIAAVAGPATPEDALLGTPAYLAPERLTGGAIEPASDVYALGVLLYRLLAGVAPWTVETTTQMINAHVYSEPAPLPPLPGVPDEVADLVARCLRKDPAERPDAAEVSGVLGDAAEAASAKKPDFVRETAPAWADVTREGVASDGAVRDTTVLMPRAAGPRAVAVDRAPPVPPWWKRRKVLAGAGLAALLIALPLLWPGADERNAGRDVAPPPGSSPSVTETVPGASSGTRPAAAATRSGRAAQPSDGASAVPAPLPSLPQPSLSAGPQPGPIDGSTAPSGPGVPESARLESPGGSVLARCAGGNAELLATEPAPGFTVDRVEPGPALAPYAVFAKDLTRYRMTVTCVGARPSAVVLPL